MARVNLGNITIEHHWTGDPVHLHSFRHKGYWFRGFRRERATMLAFARLVERSHVVFDVGAHIGYTALYFAHLASDGEVFAFEPAPGNLAYLRRNVSAKPMIKVVESAVGASDGTEDLHEEALTGQNSTLLESEDSLQRTERWAHVRAKVRRVTVPTTTLDSYVEEIGTTPDIVKIDVEGYELEVLQGAEHILAEKPPILMVEITRNVEEVEALLRSNGYVALDARLQELEQLSRRPRNTFFLHAVRHAAALARYAVSSVGT